MITDRDPQLQFINVYIYILYKLENKEKKLHLKWVSIFGHPSIHRIFKCLFIDPIGMLSLYSNIPVPSRPNPDIYTCMWKQSKWVFM